MTGLVFAAGLFLGVLISGFAVGLAAAAKRGDEQLESSLHAQRRPLTP